MNKTLQNKYHLCASSFLSIELMFHKNRHFIDRTFKQMNELEKEEIYSWEMIPESERFFRNRPIGNKPYETKHLLIKELGFVDMLYQEGLDKFTDIIIRKDQVENQKKIESSFGFGNPNYGIFYNIKNQTVEHIWLDLEELKKTDIKRVSNILVSIGERHQMILVDWHEKIIINLTDISEIREYLNLNLR